MAHGSAARWPDDDALDSLGQAAGALERLEGSADDEASLYARTVSCVENLCAAITACEAAGIERNEILAHLARARAVHRGSPFIARAQDWPRGYPGDFETIEYLCDAVNQAPPGTVGHAIERHALSFPMAQQHRNKVQFQAERIVETFRRRGGRARILSIGCGGCRDIRSIADQLLGSEVELVLCDLDEEALEFALRRLGRLADRCTYLNAIIPRVLRRLTSYGPFDLAIAGGLFDYLPDRWVTLSVGEITKKLLARDGELIFTNIRRGNPFRVWMEYLANWMLTERTDEELAQLCAAAGVPASHVAMTLEPAGLAILVRIRNPWS